MSPFASQSIGPLTPWKLITAGFDLILVIACASVRNVYCGPLPLLTLGSAAAIARPSVECASRAPSAHRIVASNMFWSYDCCCEVPLDLSQRALNALTSGPERGKPGLTPVTPFSVCGGIPAGIGEG